MQLAHAVRIIKTGVSLLRKVLKVSPLVTVTIALKTSGLTIATLVDLSRVDRQTTEVNYCTFGWKDIESTFDFYLESGFAKFLVKTLGEERATAIAKKYLLGIWEGDVIFWQIDKDFRVRHGEIIKYNSDGKRQKQNSYRIR